MFSDQNVIFSFNGPFGVRVDVGSSIVMLVLFLLMIGGINNPLYALVVVVSLVGSIFAHELGHAWACIVQGIPVRRIMLYGGGGYCEHARSPSARQQEFIVAMGPIVNLVIWAAGSLLVMNVNLGEFAWPILVLARINLFLAIMNLLPVQPLDGGKLLHLILLRLLSPRKAAKYTGGIGLIFAVAWIPFLFFAYLFLGFILFFMPSIKQHWDMWKLN